MMIFLLTLSLPAPAPAPPEAADVRLIVGETRDVPVGEESSLELRAVNRTDGPVQVLSFQPSCGCTAVGRIPSDIPAGGETTIRAVVTGATRPGRRAVRFTLRFRSKDGDAGEASGEAVLNYVDRPVIRLTGEKMLFLTHQVPGDSFSVELPFERVAGASGGGLEVADVPAWMSCDVQAGGGDEAGLVLRGVVPNRVGEYRGRLSVTDLERPGALSVVDYLVETHDPFEVVRPVAVLGGPFRDSVESSVSSPVAVRKPVVAFSEEVRGRLNAGLTGDREGRQWRLKLSAAGPAAEATRGSVTLRFLLDGVRYDVPIAVVLLPAPRAR